MFFPYEILQQVFKKACVIVHDRKVIALPFSRSLLYMEQQGLFLFSITMWLVHESNALCLCVV